MRISLVLGLGAALTLAACGDKEEETDEGTTDGTDGVDGTTGEDGTGGTTTTSDGTDGTDGTTGGTTDPLFTAMSGTVTLEYTSGEDTLCDATISFTGSDYGGDCEDCVFNFEVEASVDSEAGSGCDYDGFSPVTFYHSTYEQFATFHYEYEYAGYYEDYVYTNNLQTGYGVSAYGYPGPYWNFAINDDSPYGSASITDGELSWTFESSGEDTYYDFRNFCGTYDTYTGSAAYASDAPIEGSVDCGGFYYGYWYSGDLFDLYISADDAASGALQVSADTVSDATTGDLTMWLNDGDQCVAVLADDEHECTFPPPDWGCPSINSAVDPGSYTLVVAAWDNCADTTVDYRLDVINGEASLRTAGYEPVAGSTPWTLSVSGTATLTE